MAVSTMLIGSAAIIETLFSTFKEEEDSSASLITPFLLVLLSSGMGKRLFSLIFFFFLPSLKGLDLVFLVLSITAVVATASFFFLLSFSFSFFLSSGFQSYYKEGFHGCCGSFVVSFIPIQRQLSLDKYSREKHAIGQSSMSSPLALTASRIKSISSSQD